MDEPTTGLDPLMQREFYHLLREERKGGKTVFLSSHVLAEVEEVCDRVAIIRNGRLVVTEEVRALQEKSGRVLEVEFRERVDPAAFDISGVTEMRWRNRT
ncbi:MAG TPA: ABC transporter ATP-binding protein, partial [Anaerolineae bacterium]|nr:ABC transporter ATP-binding protein [Anaerolineae bacterium]